MKKVLWMAFVAVVTGAILVPARAADADNTFTFNGDVRARYEYLNNYLDLTNNQTSGDANDDAFSIAPYRVILGITGTFAKNITAHADLQYNGLFGDEFNPAKDANGGVFGPPIGQVLTPYFVTFNEPRGVQLYTGWFEASKLWNTDLSIRVGRQEHTYGTELLMGDNDYYAGLSFDGARVMWNHGHNDLNVFYYKIAEGNSFQQGLPLGAANDSDFFGATYDWHFDKGWGTVGGYFLVGQDLGGLGPVGSLAAQVPDSSVETYGVRWNRPVMNGDKMNMFDWNVEYAMQSGDAFGPAPVPPPFTGNSVSLAGWIGEGWFGFNYKVGDSHGRAHIGALLISGDDPNTTNKFESFIPLYGDFHANNRLGDLDWIDEFGASNTTDFNIGYDHWFGTMHHVMVAYHKFKLTEKGNSTSDDLGDEIDLSYDYMYSKNLNFQVLVGQANPGDFFGPNTDPVQRVAVQAHLHW